LNVFSLYSSLSSISMFLKFALLMVFQSSCMFHLCSLSVLFFFVYWSNSSILSSIPDTLFSSCSFYSRLSPELLISHVFLVGVFTTFRLDWIVAILWCISHY
jgi:hypothetical protein